MSSSTLSFLYIYYFFKRFIDVEAVVKLKDYLINPLAFISFFAVESQECRYSFSFFDLSFDII